MKPYPSLLFWLSPPSLSPCCLMFQFGGSKHSIRQINCLMHVISQTVYERGAPRPGAASPPPTAATSFSLPCSPRAHCLLSYRQTHPGLSLDAEASVHTHIHTSTTTETRIFTHAHTHNHRHIHERYTGKHSCMHGRSLKAYTYTTICMKILMLIYI